MISLSRVLLVATLLRGINGAAEATDALRSSRLAPHKPFNTGNKPQTMIRGLLGLRQVSCYPGYSPCTGTTTCCPTGNSCCNTFYYCSLNGCSGCVNEGDFPCSDGDGCCRMLYILTPSIFSLFSSAKPMAIPAVRRSVLQFGHPELTRTGVFLWFQTVIPLILVDAERLSLREVGVRILQGLIMLIWSRSGPLLVSLSFL
ncbi:hypothetical protein C8F04DRAFT_1098140 [Mycena alexandri]|uniref:Granulins domain-containing protein n=1 Tax=Mycena alexandri TaxID=1745969 RepID=A0AAD6T1M6_9AGAR|nr:hypothetical protein C8F04DRAFT_1098140 [Mycena alexandri]